MTDEVYRKSNTIEDYVRILYNMMNITFKPSSKPTWKDTLNYISGEFGEKH